MAGRWFQFYADLPAEYDDRTRVALAPTGGIIVAHPEHPPRWLRDGVLTDPLDVPAEAVPSQVSKFR